MELQHPKGKQKMTHYCFSIDGGDSYLDGEYSTRKEALRAALEFDSTLTEIHTGVAVPVHASELAEAVIDGDAITERLAEVAGELVGEAADDWPSYNLNSKEFKSFLNKMAAQLTWFINEHDKPNFYQVQAAHAQTAAEINVMKAEIEADRKTAAEAIAAIAKAKTDEATTTRKETTK